MRVTSPQALHRALLLRAQKRGWTFDELAQRTGLSRTTLWRLKTQPGNGARAEAAFKLLRALNLELDLDEP